MACKYKDCNEPVNSPHDEELCVFHAPIENKGEYSNFHHKILDKLSHADCNYKGFIFPKGFVFRGGGKKEGGKIQFSRSTDFSEAKFYGCVDFKGAIFKSNASFDNAEFHENTRFEDVTFEYDVNFNKAKFYKDVSFYNSNIKGIAIFAQTHFKEFAHFDEAEFAEEAVFTGALFSKASFIFVKFNKTVYFIHNSFENSINFTEMRFGENAIFYFQNPQFITKNVLIDPIVITFDRVKFNPYKSFFENVKYESDNSKIKKLCDNILNIPVLIFRFCSLGDVYFIKSDLYHFSFYTSYFDYARFISCNWGKKEIGYKRENLIFEESYINYLKNKDITEEQKSFIPEYRLQDLSYEDVSSLYRRMKTALDNTKDYQEASKFYFNEFEMKRCALEERIESESSWLMQPLKKFFSKLTLYKCYKTFAGYGEKPWRSTIWFALFSLLFAFIHMFNGIDRGSEYQNEIKYSLKKFINYSDYLKIIADIITAWFYSLSRVIPVSYLSENPSGYSPMGPNGSLISFFNSLILIILAIFIAIGLKRHFRRF